MLKRLVKTARRRPLKIMRFSLQNRGLERISFWAIRIFYRRSVHFVGVPPAERAPILSEYVRVATSGRHHFPVVVGAPLSEFQVIAERYPVYRLDPS